MTRTGFAGLACALLLTLALIDIGSSFFYRSSTSTALTILAPRSGVTTRAIIIAPGYTMSGEVVARAFFPYATDTDALMAIDYAERGVDPLEIYQHIRRELDTLNPQDVALYGASMGGILAARLLEIYKGDGAPFGKITLFLDTAPSGPEDIKRPAWLFRLSCRARGGAISSAVLALLNARAIQPPPGPGSHPALIMEGRKRGRWIGFPAAATQACFIWNTRIPNRNLLGAVIQRSFYLTGEDPENDPLIRTDQAISTWRDHLGPVSPVVVNGRQGKWHIPLVEYPQSTMDVITERR